MIVSVAELWVTLLAARLITGVAWVVKLPAVIVPDTGPLQLLNDEFQASMS